MRGGRAARGAGPHPGRTGGAAHVPLDPNCADHEVVGLVDDAGSALHVRDAPIERATARGV